MSTHDAPQPEWGHSTPHLGMVMHVTSSDILGRHHPLDPTWTGWWSECSCGWEAFRDSEADAMSALDAHALLVDVRPTAPRRTVHCSFDWCGASHHDDWADNGDGDASRFHTIDLPSFAKRSIEGPYLFVEEVRTTHGVRYSAAAVQVDADERLTVDEFAARLTALADLMPLWRDAEQQVEERMQSQEGDR